MLSGVSSRRVSDTTSEEWFTPELIRQIRKIERRLCKLFGIQEAHLEPWQATRYRSGGKFETHLDGGSFAHEPAGEREVTLLLYLTTPPEGGSTRFPELTLDIHARAGTVVAWKNRLDDGRIDERMKHAARPLRKGRKLVLTTWSREHPIRE